MSKTRKISPYEARQLKTIKQLRENRKYWFSRYLGEDHKDIEDLLESSISPHDVENLLNKGCPKKLISEILL